MVPVDGDDLRWREQVSGRMLVERAREIREIESDLHRGFEVETERRTFHWTFDEPEIPKLVAASAVVCFGWRDLRYQRLDNLNRIGWSLMDRVDDDGSFTLSQEALVWLGKRRAT
jgi:hypothetical protein